jgi:hypothetical protein
VYFIHGDAFCIGSLDLHNFRGWRDIHGEQILISFTARKQVTTHKMVELLGALTNSFIYIYSLYNLIIRYTVRASQQGPAN